MAPAPTQYHHYIPRFILKRFAHDIASTYTSRDSRQDGLPHVFDFPSEQFFLGEVSKTCGTQNLYYNPKDSNPMRVEHLFSKLESKASWTLDQICKAVAEGRDHIEILEKDIHYRDEVNNPYRENDFMFQQKFAAAKKEDSSISFDQIWLNELLYLLETSHEDLLADAERAGDNAGDDSVHNASARTYKHFVDNYAMQIWKAAKGHQFFLNDRIIDFEGDTEYCLGAETKETGAQLMWMTWEKMIHLILPIDPEVAVVLCDESQCWESPFADMMHKVKIPYPQNSLLKNAPHKDIVNVDVPSQKRGKKRWPATVAWRVHIGTLSREHNRIVTSYSLSHAESFVVVQRRELFEKAKRDLEAFSEKQLETCKKQGIRVISQKIQRQHTSHEPKGLSEEDLIKVADKHLYALDDIMNAITTTQEPLPRTKENACKSWIQYNGMNTALKAAFEAAYPAQPPDYRNLITINFGQFLDQAIGDDTFAKLSFTIDEKIRELVHDDAFHVHWESCKLEPQPLSESPSPDKDNVADMLQTLLLDHGIGRQRILKFCNGCLSNDKIF